MAEQREDPFKDCKPIERNPLSDGYIQIKPKNKLLPSGILYALGNQNGEWAIHQIGLFVTDGQWFMIPLRHPRFPQLQSYVFEQVKIGIQSTISQLDPSIVELYRTDYESKINSIDTVWGLRQRLDASFFTDDFLALVAKNTPNVLAVNGMVAELLLPVFTDSLQGIFSPICDKAPQLLELRRAEKLRDDGENVYPAAAIAEFKYSAKVVADNNYVESYLNTFVYPHNIKSEIASLKSTNFQSPLLHALSHNTQLNAQFTTDGKLNTDGTKFFSDLEDKAKQVSEPFLQAFNLAYQNNYTPPRN